MMYGKRGKVMEHGCYYRGKCTYMQMPRNDVLIRVDLAVSNLCQNGPRHSLLQKKKGHWWLIMNSNYSKSTRTNLIF